MADFGGEAEARRLHNFAYPEVRLTCRWPGCEYKGWKELDGFCDRHHEKNEMLRFELAEGLD